MLLDPPDGSLLDTLIPALTWTKGDDPFIHSISLDIAKDPEFYDYFFGASFSYWGAIYTHQLDKNLEPNTQYYWRTQTICGNGTIYGPYSETWTFTSGSGGTIPRPPILQSPANGDTIASIPVTLSWQPVSGATGYLVTWQNIDKYWWGYLWVDKPSITLDDLDANATYKWSVQVRNEYAISDASEEWRFTTPTGAIESEQFDTNVEVTYTDETSQINHSLK